MKNVREKHPNKRVRVFTQDEGRFGLQPIIRKIWWFTGLRPTIEIHPRYEWFYTCSAVEPSSGESFTQLWSTMNLDCMQYWLDCFSNTLDKNEMCILVLDGAGWHSEKGLKWPENIIPLYQPAYSPECNPAERLWTWIKEHIANYVFDSLKEMKDKVIDVINGWDNEKQVLVSWLNYHWWNEAVN